MAIWELPFRVLYPVVAVEMAAVMLCVTFVGDGRLTLAGPWLTAAALTVTGGVHSEIARGIERMRRRISVGTNSVDLSSVWTFAGAVLLPPLLAAGTAVVIHGYLWARSWRRRTALYRHAFSSATVVLACLAASSIVARFIGVSPQDGSVQFGPGSLWALTLAVVVYTVVNSLLIAGAIALSTPEPTFNSVFSSVDENVLELATLCVGALLALAMTVSIWLAWLVVLPLVVLHRAALVRQLQVAANTDQKTGLINAAAWHVEAQGALLDERSRGVVRGVLICDLDWFKVVNDSYGHLIGDQVLAEIAGVLRSSVRPDDVVGRFGGEEFVVLVRSGPGEDEHSAVKITAERLRRRVAEHVLSVQTPDGPLTLDRLTISVGGAEVGGAASRSLTALLGAADAALLAAKRAGRNRVVVVGGPATLADPAAADERAGRH